MLHGKIDSSNHVSYKREKLNSSVMTRIKGANVDINWNCRTSSSHSFPHLFIYFLNSLLSILWVKHKYLLFKFDKFKLKVIMCILWMFGWETFTRKATFTVSRGTPSSRISSVNICTQHTLTWVNGQNQCA